MPEFADYKVADIGLADWGRREIAIAEADSGEFASKAEVEAFFAKWRPDAEDAG